VWPQRRQGPVRERLHRAGDDKGLASGERRRGARTSTGRAAA
jgi:hypothetical protein